MYVFPPDSDDSEEGEFTEQHYAASLQLSDTVHHVKNEVYKKTGVAPRHQNLWTYASDGKKPRDLEDRFQLSHYFTAATLGQELGFTADPRYFDDDVQIQVQTTTGKTIMLNDVDCKADIKTIKHSIYRQTNIPVVDQLLYSRGRSLENIHTLGYYELFSGATIHMRLSLNGGIDGEPPSGMGPRGGGGQRLRLDGSGHRW